MHKVRTFLEDDAGNATLEFIILMPFFMFLVILFTDSSIVYLTHTEMFNVARDLARRMSTREITTQEQVLDYAQSHLMLSHRNYFVDARFGGDMIVNISVHIGDAAIFGMFFQPILGRVMIASAVMRQEPLDI